MGLCHYQMGIKAVPGNTRNVEQAVEQAALLMTAYVSLMVVLFVDLA